MRLRKTLNIACIGILLVMLGMVCSCRNASKAKPVIEEVVNSYKAASKSDAIRYLKTKNRMEMAEDLYNEITVPNPCSTCNGYGVVYQIDSYGNPVTDYYGNIQFLYCPSCGGTGQE